MPLIHEEDRQTLKEMFEKAFVDDVKLVLFTQDHECQYCKETHQLVDELGQITERIKTEVYDFVKDKDQVESYRIDKIPALAIVGQKDYGVRFFGIPSGYEFTGLIETIMAISKGDSGLRPETKSFLKNLKEPLHFQVFVTPTCPYCPSAVHLAHLMAIESDMVTADGVEVIEFPHLGTKYGVQGVPRTVINETAHIEGAAPEPTVVEKMREVVVEQPA